MKICHRGAETQRKAWGWPTVLPGSSRFRRSAIRQFRSFLCASVSLWLLSAAFAQVPASTASAPQNQNENAQKAVTILNQTIRALGGQAWVSIRDLEQEGRIWGFYHGRPSGAGAPFWRFWK